MRRIQSILIVLVIGAIGCVARTWTDYLAGTTVSERDLTMAAKTYLATLPAVESVTVKEVLRLTVVIKGGGEN